jgi:hypothetical protein
MSYPGEEAMSAKSAKFVSGPSMAPATGSGQQPLIPALSEALYNLMQELTHINARMDGVREQLGSTNVEQTEKVNHTPANLQQTAQRCMELARTIDYKLRELGV